MWYNIFKMVDLLYRVVIATWNKVYNFLGRKKQNLCLKRLRLEMLETVILFLISDSAFLTIMIFLENEISFQLLLFDFFIVKVLSRHCLLFYLMNLFVYLITFTKKIWIRAKKKWPQWTPCRLQILHILFVRIGKKPALSQQDSVYCLWDVKLKLLDNSKHLI